MGKISAEYKRKYYHANKERISAQRKARRKSPEQKAKAREYYIKWRDKNSDRLHDWHLNKTFGISLSDYKAMFYKQHGRCAICGKESVKPRLGVDHCHKTGKIRGLLCKSCNHGIGLLGDNAWGVNRAVKYLERTASWTL